MLFFQRLWSTKSEGVTLTSVWQAIFFISKGWSITTFIGEASSCLCAKLQRGVLNKETNNMGKTQTQMLIIVTGWNCDQQLSTKPGRYEIYRKELREATGVTEEVKNAHLLFQWPKQRSRRKPEKNDEKIVTKIYTKQQQKLSPESVASYRWLETKGNARWKHYCKPCSYVKPGY